jgi:hypothetical protein
VKKGAKSGVNCYSVDGAKLVLCEQEVRGGTKLVVYIERDLRRRDASSNITTTCGMHRKIISSEKRCPERENEND